MRVDKITLLLGVIVALSSCSSYEQRDADGDGFTVEGGDCDDEVSAINPAQTDIAGDATDQNCDGVDGTDGDGDGVASEVSGGDDCDDAAPGSFPGNPEIFGDGVDQDCNGADRTDESFVAEGVEEVDLLWVVDDSCSMSDKQGRLAEAVPDMVAALDDTGLTWRIGVITTDMDAFERRGKLVADDGTGDRWFDSDLDGVEGALARVFDVGISRAADEKGRAAVYTALVVRAASDNSGFRRPDAHLAIAVLTDENDYSGTQPIALPAFIAWFDGASPVGGRSFHGIVGPEAGCPTSWEPGVEYAAVVDAIGGAQESICAPDYGPFMTAMASWFDGIPFVFPLASAPIEGSIQVFITPVGGEPELTQAWTYRADEVTVALDAPPERDSTVRIEYDVAL